MAIENILLHDIADKENIWIEAHRELTQRLQLMQQQEPGKFLLVAASTPTLTKGRI